MVFYVQVLVVSGHTLLVYLQSSTNHVPSGEHNKSISFYKHQWDSSLYQPLRLNYPSMPLFFYSYYILTPAPLSPTLIPAQFYSRFVSPAAGPSNLATVGSGHASCATESRCTSPEVIKSMTATAIYPPMAVKTCHLV